MSLTMSGGEKLGHILSIEILNFTKSNVWNNLILRFLAVVYIQQHIYSMIEWKIFIKFR